MSTFFLKSILIYLLISYRLSIQVPIYNSIYFEVPSSQTVVSIDVQIFIF